MKRVSLARGGILLLILFAAMDGFTQEEKIKKEPVSIQASVPKPHTDEPDFFPLFPWGGFGESENMIRSLHECNFNMSGFIAEKGLASSAKYKMKAFLNVIVLDKKKLPGITQEDADAIIIKATAPTKDDPAVLGYYLIDEPGTSLFPALAKLNRSIEKYAPGKLLYINLFPSYGAALGSDPRRQLQADSFTEYLERYVQEVKPHYISYDNYMVEYSEDMSRKDRAEIYWNDLMEVRRIAQKYKLPWWNIVSCLCIRKESSPPSPARFAFQAYTSLAAGANGLSWFICKSPGRSYSPLDEQNRKTLTWSYMREINEQILTLGTILCDYESTNIWFTEPGSMKNLPKNPKKILNEIHLSWSKLGENIQDSPSVMVGEFKARDGSHEAIMAVNLNFGRSVKIDFDFIKKYEKIEGISPNDGHRIEKTPVNGWWILPGHGSLFLLKPLDR
ncbi:MAG: hypothetical protein Q4G69_05500 [Planctomycetia bacterium]|nr:hypothetical protein [Planctomycetia bacterium]